MLSPNSAEMAGIASALINARKALVTEVTFLSQLNMLGRGWGVVPVVRVICPTVDTYKM